MVFILLTQIPNFDVINLQFLYGAGILFAFSCAAMVGISLATASPPEEKVKNLVWTRELWREESRELEGNPWYYSYRFWSLVLIIITAILVIAIW